MAAAPDTAGRSTARRKARAPAPRGLRLLGLRLAFLLACLVSWQGLVSTEVLSEFWVSSPVSLVRRFVAMLADGSLPLHTGITLGESLAGLVLGAAVGIAGGFLFARWELLAEVLEPYIMALNSLPRVALAPLLIIWVGIGLLSKIMLAFSLVAVIMLVNTYAGTRSIDPVLVNALRMLGARQRDIFVKITLPHSVPWIFAGLRVSVAFAYIGAVVGEFLGSTKGIGFLIDRASGAFNTTGILVPLLALMLLAVALNALMLRLEKRLLKWRPPQVGQL
ncbi:MAG: ABC transporter permease [Candidatus Tectomicrobia bacterium]|nr:ABC transporter permease [Candidatus Tectomicrobia bacterium]